MSKGSKGAILFYLVPPSLEELDEQNMQETTRSHICSETRLAWVDYDYVCFNVYMQNGDNRNLFSPSHRPSWTPISCTTGYHVIALPLWITSLHYPSRGQRACIFLPSAFAFERRLCPHFLPLPLFLLHSSSMSSCVHLFLDAAAAATFFPTINHRVLRGALRFQFLARLEWRKEGRSKYSSVRLMPSQWKKYRGGTVMCRRLRESRISNFVAIEAILIQWLDRQTRRRSSLITSSCTTVWPGFEICW